MATLSWTGKFLPRECEEAGGFWAPLWCCVRDCDATLARDGAEHQSGSLQVPATGACGALCQHPWGGVAPQPPPSDNETAVTLQS